MLAGRALSAALRRAPLVPFEGVLCRAVDAATLYGFQKKAPYRPRPLYDLGPPRSGGRFTPRGGVPALYLAEDYETSLHEYVGIGAHVRLRPASADRTIVLFSAEVSLEAVLDLTSHEVLAALRTTKAELREPWLFRRDGRTPPTHALGRAVARHGGIQAIRFASTKGKGTCFCVLTATIVRPAFVRVRDPASKLVAELP